jgi:hypothetical protein
MKSNIQALNTSQNETFHFSLKLCGLTVANSAKVIPPVPVRKSPESNAPTPTIAAKKPTIVLIPILKGLGIVGPNIYSTCNSGQPRSGKSGCLRWLCTFIFSLLDTYFIGADSFAV